MKIPNQPGVRMRLTDPETLRKWLDHKGMSYADLGQAVGVSKQFIHQLVSGQRNGCSPLVAARIEQVLLAAPCHRMPGELPLFVPLRSEKIGDISETIGAA